MPEAHRMHLCLERPRVERAAAAILQHAGIATDDFLDT